MVWGYTNDDGALILDNLGYLMVGATADDCCCAFDCTNVTPLLVTIAGLIPLPNGALYRKQFSQANDPHGRLRYTCTGTADEWVYSMTDATGANGSHSTRYPDGVGWPTYETPDQRYFFQDPTTYYGPEITIKRYTYNGGTNTIDEESVAAYVCIEDLANNWCPTGVIEDWAFRVRVRVISGEGPNSDLVVANWDVTVTTQADEELNDYMPLLIDTTNTFGSISFECGGGALGHDFPDHPTSCGCYDSTQPANDGSTATVSP